MREELSPYFSRFAVICEQQKAWAVDHKFRSCAFDGTRFWRRRGHGTRYEIVPSWKTPAFGWMHAAECDCSLCAHESQAVSRAA